MITTPEKSIEVKDWRSDQCEGSIDKAEVEDRNGHRIISFSGWVAVNGAKLTVPDDVFLIISSPDSGSIYLETLKVPRLDVNKNFGIPKNIDTGFSRLISGNLKLGEYEVKVLQYSDGQYRSCQFKKKL